VDDGGPGFGQVIMGDWNAPRIPQSRIFCAEWLNQRGKTATAFFERVTFSLSASFRGVQLGQKMRGRPRPGRCSKPSPQVGQVLVSLSNGNLPAFGEAGPVLLPR
jgi:hypothetical protein